MRERVRKKSKKEVAITYALMFLVMGLGVFLVYFFGGSFTGYATYEQSNQSGFDEGVYNNTQHNGSAVVLSSGQTLGTYTSKVFDAGADAVWNNLTKTSTTPLVEFLFAVDGSGDIYSSSNLSANWNSVRLDYGRASDTEEMFADSYYLYIIARSNREIWRSGNGGLNWSVISTFSGSALVLGEVNSTGNLFVVGGSGNVYVSYDYGVTWSLQGDFNGGATNIGKGMGINSNGTIYITDASGAVYSSSNFGVNWAQKTSGYGGGSGTDDLEVDSSGNLYILNNKQVYKSTNLGVNWTIINNSFTSYAGDGSRMLIDSNNLFFISDASGRTFKSTNSGITWIEKGDVNAGAGNNVFGIAEFNKSTNLSIQVRNCSKANCSDGTWQSVDLNNFNLSGRYFQYRVNFSSPAIGYTSSLSSVNVNYELINVAPSVSIASPSNGVPYGYNQTIYLNFTANDNDGNLASCWYSLNGGSNSTLAGCNNISFNIINSGTYTIVVYANDSLGLIGGDSVSFEIINVAPTISLISPQNGASYGYNESIALNFVVSDGDGNLDNCWYNLDSGENIRLSSCANTTFDVSGDGSYILNIYVNDTLGEEDSDSATFNVQIGAPTVELNYPLDAYLNNSEIVFRYTPEDLDLDSCELWGDFDGLFKLNQTDTNPLSGGENTFSLNLLDGIYLWNIKCNDSVGNFAFNGNKTFYVDLIEPNIIMTQPTGTKDSRINIPLTFSVNDSSPTNCWYNVYRGENIENADTILPNCSSTSFSVTLDANFVLNLYANDSAGNFDSKNSAFTVTTNTVTPPNNGGSSGGGGGGGGGIVITAKTVPKLELSGVSNLILNKGIKRDIEVNVKNIGTSFLNECAFNSSGEHSSWLSSDFRNNIAAGEKTSFNLEVNIPSNIEPGEYKMEYSVGCQEVTEKVNFTIEILEQKIGFEVIEIKRISNTEIKAVYVLEELSGAEQIVEMQFLLMDTAGNKIAEMKNANTLFPNSKQDFEIIILVDSSLRGELKLLVNLNSGTYSNFVQKDVILGSPISGFSIFGRAVTSDNLTSAFLIFAFLIFACVMIKIILKHRKAFKRKK